MNNAAFNPPLFRAPFAPPDEDLAAGFLVGAGRDAAAERRVDARARGLVEAIRRRAGGLGGIEDFLHAYSLSTKEGLALMVLAEALLRVPDSVTADRIIEGLMKRLGLPVVRAATREAMRLLGSHFVLGQSIEEALQRAHDARVRYSFDMLGEGARTAADAARYLSAYAAAIDAIGARAGERALPDRPGISVKLSALHPRFEAVSRERVLRELTPSLIELARKARAHDLNFKIGRAH